MTYLSDPIGSFLGTKFDPNFSHDFDLSQYEHESRFHFRTGQKHTEETKILIAKKATGRKHTEETKEKMSKISKHRYENGNGEVFTMKGKTHTKETKSKMSKSSKGVSDKTRQSQLSYMTGKVLPPDWTESQRKARLGKKIYNNGIKNIMANPDDVPEGFVLGKMRKG